MRVVLTDQPRTLVGRGTALAVMVGALILGALLNAEPLADTAAAQPDGWQRDTAMAVTGFLVDVSDAVGLDEPHEALDTLRSRDAVVVEPDGPGEVFVPTADRPARLWVAGDSLVQTIGPAIVNAAAETGVVEGRYDVQYSSGLARPELYDWPASLLTGARSEPTDIVVFMVGANDGQAIETAGGFAGFGTDEWTAEYETRVGSIMDALSENVATVYWIGLPVAADDRLTERFAVMNRVFGDQAADRPAVTYIDLSSAFAGPDGAYAPLLPDAGGRLIRARDPDGIHFTPDGADLVAAAVLDVIGDAWRFDSD